MPQCCLVLQSMMEDAVRYDELAPPPRYSIVSLSVHNIEEGLNLPTLIFSQRYARRCRAQSAARFVKASHWNDTSSKPISQTVEIHDDVVSSGQMDLRTTRQLEYECTVIGHCIFWLRFKIVCSRSEAKDDQVPAPFPITLTRFLLPRIFSEP